MATDRWTATHGPWTHIHVHGLWLVPAVATILGVALVAWPSTREPTLVDGGTRLGDVRLFAPEDVPAELVFLFSDRDGWTGHLDDVAGRMMAEDAAVLGIDLKAYLGALRDSDDRDCHYLDSEIEQLSKQVEKQLGMPTYRWPIMAGTGMGGTVAYGAAAQAPAATVAGAIVVDPASWIETRVPLCPGAPATPYEADGCSYGPMPDMPGWLRVAERQTPRVMPWVDQIKEGRKVALARDADVARPRLPTCFTP